MQNRNNFGILLVSGVFALGAVGVALLFQKSGDKVVGDGSSVRVVQSNTEKKAYVSANEDDDGDGLTNWRETLFGTDPQKADTDGDGVSDSDEIAQGSSPTVFGTEPINKDRYVAPKALSSTDAIARELFASYASFKTGTLSNDDVVSSIEDIVDRRLANGDGVQSAATVYDLSDITISETATLETYIGAVDRALQLSKQIREYELSVFARAVQKSGGENGLTKLKKSVTVYRDIQTQLLALPVPDEVIVEHLIFVNSLESFIFAIDAMTGWSGDAFEAMVLVGDYGEAEDEMVASMAQLYEFVTTLQKQT